MMFMEQNVSDRSEVGKRCLRTIFNGRRLFTQDTRESWRTGVAFPSVSRTADVPLNPGWSKTNQLHTYSGNKDKTHNCERNIWLFNVLSKLILVKRNKCQKQSKQTFPSVVRESANSTFFWLIINP